jgi:hypothetical protein
MGISEGTVSPLGSSGDIDGISLSLGNRLQHPTRLPALASLMSTFSITVDHLRVEDELSVLERNRAAVVALELSTNCFIADVAHESR